MGCSCNRGAAQPASLAVQAAAASMVAATQGSCTVASISMASQEGQASAAATETRLHRDTGILRNGCN